jgi:carboxylesterase
MNPIIRRGVKILVILIVLALFTRLFTWFVVTTEDSIVERNPDGTIVGTEAVYEEGCDTAVLLLHGLGSSPSDFWQFYPIFYRKGVTVDAPLIEGHGTSPKELGKTPYESWILSAEIEYAKLKEEGKDVVVVGNCMGSLLALELASKHEVEQLILVNPPLKLKSKLVNVLPLFWLFETYHPNDLFSSQDDDLPGFAVTYKVYPLRSISELLELQERVTEKLGEVDDPIVVFQSEKDTTVDPDGTKTLDDNVKSEDKDITFLSNSTHVHFSEEDLKMINKIINSKVSC